MPDQNDSSRSPWYARLHVQILLAMVAGAILGQLFGHTAVWLLGWMGTIFIRLLRMIIVPLIFTSIVTGVAWVCGGEGMEKRIF